LLLLLMLLLLLLLLLLLPHPSFPPPLRRLPVQPLACAVHVSIVRYVWGGLGTTVIPSGSTRILGHC
jgi:hypothetical protein